MQARMLLLGLLVASLCQLAQASIQDRYDLNLMPFDLRPVRNFIGLWAIEGQPQGHARDLPAPSRIDFAINPIPKFGARTVNITHTYLDGSGQVYRSDYGFMPVKNASRVDPRVHVAYLTTSSEGYSMMEQGFFENNRLVFHLKQFLRRSFDVGSRGVSLEVRQFERQYELDNPFHMTMRVQASTNVDTEQYTASYRKLL